ncbi:adenylate isopentenyltransferase 5, chloroplastic-like protein [Cinnamomum micranthum f. kanehirae]|uniref:adenylate dimethylallyltransferase (ADP/ATP-dependent) n=1 Tax=Cinnamomum micranthum f. kanehirae TaxID=337451 RepID=A0A443PSF3_9MAGN|nr:adenylate isopentenyltransferase 5, chloroplastic-like protein [Cinnamomum micranthum f. kanehirae]
MKKSLFSHNESSKSSRAPIHLVASQIPRRKRAKVVFVMGATGTGKSKLSIDLATHFSAAEIINSDKIQVYKGLDIVTNKVTRDEQHGIPHHLLGVLDPDSDFTAAEFCNKAVQSIESITANGKLPIIAGGSNSFIEALVDNEELEFRANYDCCFLWVDVSMPRVDKMVEAGLVEEVKGVFNREADTDFYTRGIRRAIGVPEMDNYLRAEDSYQCGDSDNVNEEMLMKLLEEAIDKIKANTFNLACGQVEKIHRLQTLPGWNIHRIDATEMASQIPRRKRAKVVFVMGATGTGKSKLSIDLATHFSAAEIINSDKIQVYKGLDIVTNKVTRDEQHGIPHHLLGVLDPDSDFTAAEFCNKAVQSIESITAHGKLPIIAGGSNSFIEALVDNEELEFRANYDCCFLWVDVSMPVLDSFVSERVDKMVEAGLVEEVKGVFNREADADFYTRGIRRAIGVPEMDNYLRAEDSYQCGDSDDVNVEMLMKLLEEAIDEIKANTFKLACFQVEKIHRLQTLPGWNIHRIDATEVFKRRGGQAQEAWERLVKKPGIAIVQQFLLECEQEKDSTDATAASIAVAAAIAAPMAAVTMATLQIEGAAIPTP